MQARHGEGDDGRIRCDSFDIPRESAGVSDDSPSRFESSSRFGPPRFDDAAFGVGSDGGRTALTLRRLPD